MGIAIALNDNGIAGSCCSWGSVARNTQAVTVIRVRRDVDTT
jgi:hypothetical protein